jgi:glycerate 2-kinase
LKSSGALLEYITSNVPEDDIVFVIVFGGSLTSFEISGDNVDLEDNASISKELMKRDSDVFELNTVRKMFSEVKSGKLPRFLKCRKVISLIVSDVIGDRLDTIASSPTAPNETTSQDVYNILKRRVLWNEQDPRNFSRIGLD